MKKIQIKPIKDPKKISKILKSFSGPFRGFIGIFARSFFGKLRCALRDYSRMRFFGLFKLA